MINYELLGNFLTKIFGSKINFENNKDSFLITHDMGIAPENYFIIGAPIYSAEFTFAEKKCEFILGFTVDFKRKAEYEEIVAQMNKLYEIYRIGKTTFSLHESGKTLWIRIWYTLELPHPGWPYGTTFDNESAVRCLIHFRMIANGFMLIWYKRATVLLEGL